MAEEKPPLKKSASFRFEPELLPGQENFDEPFVMPPEPEVDEETRQRRDVMRAELAAMTARDENVKEIWRARREEQKVKAVALLQKERIDKGFSIMPGSVKSKRAIRKVVKDEETIALKDKMAKLTSENSKIQAGIDDKLGISALPKGDKLLGLAEDFYSRAHVPNEHLADHIRRALTTEEISDLRRVFDLFDFKNRGYITAHDLKRVAVMLGVTAKKKVFQEMIDDTKHSKRGRVTFVGFLEIVVKLQGDGPDPHEDIRKFFDLLDRDKKGFVTFKDLRSAFDESKIQMSNKAIREMMSEADPQGHGKIRLQDLIAVLGQTSTFKNIVPDMLLS